jgi:hypothetical protein
VFNNTGVYCMLASTKCKYRQTNIDSILANFNLVKDSSGLMSERF